MSRTPDNFVPYHPTQRQVDRRKGYVENPLWSHLFPVKVIELHGATDEARRLTENGVGINVLVGPHPGEGDSFRVPGTLFEIDPNLPVLTPIAVHQRDSLIKGSISRAVLWWYGTMERSVVTARTEEKYPGRYSGDQAQDMLNIMLSDLVTTVSSPGIGVEFIHGDRAATMDTLPPNGILTLPFLKAKKMKVVDKIALMFAYFHNPLVSSPEELRGLDLGREMTLITGDVVMLSDAIKQAEKTADAYYLQNHKKIPPLDLFAYQQISQIHLTALERGLI